MYRLIPILLFTSACRTTKANTSSPFLNCSEDFKGISFGSSNELCATTTYFSILRFACTEKIQGLSFGVNKEFCALKTSYRSFEHTSDSQTEPFSNCEADFQGVPLGAHSELCLVIQAPPTAQQP